MRGAFSPSGLSCSGRGQRLCRCSAPCGSAAWCPGLGLRTQEVARRRRLLQAYGIGEGAFGKTARRSCRELLGLFIGLRTTGRYNSPFRLEVDLQFGGVWLLDVDLRSHLQSEGMSDYGKRKAFDDKNGAFTALACYIYFTTHFALFVHSGLRGMRKGETVEQLLQPFLQLLAQVLS